jgi:hypothetical protein
VKSERLLCVGHVSKMGETRNAYKILMRKPLGKRPTQILGRCKENTEMNVRKTGSEDGTPPMAHDRMP